MANEATETTISTSPPALETTSPALARAPSAPAAPAHASLGRRVLHYGVAIAILFGLWYFDRLRLEDFIHAGFDWPWALAALGLLLPSYVLGALRLQCVLRGMNVPCTVGQALTFTFYGAIGELALPFVIGGDLVKAVYVGRSANRSTAVASVLADRIIGLLGLCVFALLAAVAQIHVILADVLLQQVMLILVVISGIGLAGCLALIAFHQVAAQTLRRHLPKLPAGEKLLSVLRVLKQLCLRPNLWISLALSVVGHGIWALTVILLARALKLDTPFVPTLLVLPIVAFSNTVSFAGGIGGGLLAFEYLFHHVLGAAAGDGARLGLALPIVLTVSKAYAIPWLFLGRKSSSDA